MKHQPKPIPSKQLKAFYEALLAHDPSAIYTEEHLRFLQQRRDLYLASLKS